MIQWKEKIVLVQSVAEDVWWKRLSFCFLFAKSQQIMPAKALMETLFCLQKISSPISCDRTSCLFCVLWGSSMVLEGPWRAAIAPPPISCFPFLIPVLCWPGLREAQWTSREMAVIKETQAGEQRVWGNASTWGKFCLSGVKHCYLECKVIFFWETGREGA